GEVVLLEVVEEVLDRAAQAVVLGDRAVQVHHVRDRAGGQDRRQFREVVVPGLEADLDRGAGVLGLEVLHELGVEVALEADLGRRDPVEREVLAAGGRLGGLWRGGRLGRGRAGRRRSRRRGAGRGGRRGGRAAGRRGRRRRRAGWLRRLGASLGRSRRRR